VTFIMTLCMVWGHFCFISYFHFVGVLGKAGCGLGPVGRHVDLAPEN